MVRLSISNQKQGRKGLLLCVMYEIYKRGNLFSLVRKSATDFITTNGSLNLTSPECSNIVKFTHVARVRQLRQARLGQGRRLNQLFEVNDCMEILSCICFRMINSDDQQCVHGV